MGSLLLLVLTVVLVVAIAVYQRDALLRLVVFGVLPKAVKSCFPVQRVFATKLC